MNYSKQINSVIDYIGKHLDEPLTLEKLSDVACFSKYHFHRLFTVYTGLSLNQYIRWLRLKRAANQLVVEKEKSIITIAMDAGFESHEAFTRAFKQACGMSPSQYKASKSKNPWQKLAYTLPKKRDETMQVTIKELDSRRLAMAEHHGAPELMCNTINQLIAWCDAQSPQLKPAAGESFGFAYHDPATTAPEDFRFDLGIKVSTSQKVDSPMVEKQLPAGRYAVAMHKGSHENIGETVYSLYRDWLPQSGEELGDLPCVFRYYNFAHEVAETELRTEVMLLLKD